MLQANEGLLKWLMIELSRRNVVLI
jgi:hypothetical protein